MNSKIIVGPQFFNAEYDSEPRRQGLAQLAQLGELIDEPADHMTADHADAVVAGGEDAVRRADEAEPVEAHELAPEPPRAGLDTVHPPRALCALSVCPAVARCPFPQRKRGATTVRILYKAI